MMSLNTSGAFVVPKHSVYSGSKGAIESFVRDFAKDCGKKIAADVVAPGGTVMSMFYSMIPHFNFLLTTCSLVLSQWTRVFGTDSLFSEERNSFRRKELNARIHV